MNIQEALTHFGLNEKEAGVYLAALALGRAKGQEVARNAGLPRSTTYSILDTLVQKKLILTLDDRKVREYAAEDPDKLVEQSEAAYRTMKAAQPDLAALFRGAKNRPRVRYYDGLQAIKGMYEGILLQRKKGLKDYQVIASESAFLSRDREWFTNFVKRRAAFGMHSRLILEASEDTRQKQKEEKEINSEIRILDNFYEQRSKAGIYILLKSVIFVEYTKNPVAVEMESKELVSMHRMLFEALWKTLPAASQPALQST
ncbi:MAG: helix-turn-helix domain-containing protein [Patescibacteria group bacterium]|jgi:sugar-specific transcriptional regulator TrmB